MLELTDVAPYLIERKLLTARAVVCGGLTIADVSRRNAVYLATAEGERTLVVKQGQGVDIAREAAALARLAAAGDRHLAAAVPRVVIHDPDERILVLTGEPGAIDLARHQDTGRCSPLLARVVGRTLGRLHRLTQSPGPGEIAPVDPAGVLAWHRPVLELVRESSATAVELLAMVQRSDTLCAGFDALAAEWEHATPVHGDVRWANCLAVARAGARRRTGITLIDWERAGLGDPAFDVGCMLGEYLSSWVHSIPIVDLAAPRLLLAHARRPLRLMRPAIAAFWDGYARAAGVAETDLSRRLRRAVRYSAVRVVAAALERAQEAMVLGAGAVQAVRLGENLLRRPDEAGVRLLGFEGHWPDR